jgi:hypothetical protein
MDMLSDIDTISLAGVPGKLIEVTLAFLRACLLASTFGRLGAAAGTGGGCSSFDVCTTRRTRGAGFFAGESKTAPGLSAAFVETDGVGTAAERCDPAGVAL